jgi:hypothetical protein
MEDIEIMDHNPFVTRNNDLFITYFSGVGTMVINQYVLNLSVQAQFLMVLSLGFMAGLFMNYFYQSLEWALFFALGIQTVTLGPIVLNVAMGEGSFATLIRSAFESGHYTGFLLTSWIIAVPLGFMLQKLIMSDYYRRTLF